MKQNFISFTTETWTGTLIAAIVALALAIAVVMIARFVFNRLGRRTPWLGELGTRMQASAAALTITSAVGLALALTLPGKTAWWPGVAHAILIIGVIVGAWFVSALISFGFERLITREGVIGDAEARRRRTQLVVIHRLVLAVISVVALGVVLFSFPGMRAVGTSLLATAGIGSIIIGLAAQSIFANLIAGIQLAFTDAIKVGDVVVVEGEWGKIGEINLSYVVVYIWDERRLVLPCSYFTSNPFETWTRSGDRVLGTVYMDLDWQVPMAPLRAKFNEILEASDAWDRRSSSVWVTGAEGGNVTVRFAMSSANSDDQWVLRCTVREEIVTWMQQEHPEVLPRTRVEMSSEKTLTE